jgi:hypothetical protein
MSTAHTDIHTRALATVTLGHRSFSEGRFHKNTDSLFTKLLNFLCTFVFLLSVSLCIVYKGLFHLVMLETRVEAGSNTSTVNLRVVGGDEKGSLESEAVKYGHESYGTRTRK